MCAGATARDEEDGDLSERILSCPPMSCMNFGCPGHELSRKGLSGCGIDTVRAPVGTWFSLNFTVFDLHIPAATTNVQRIVLVVSPCSQEEVYCPELARPDHPTGQHACGSSDCASRAAILALQPEEEIMIAPTVEFSDSVPRAAVYTLPPGRSASVLTIPGHEGTFISQV